MTDGELIESVYSNTAWDRARRRGDAQWAAVADACEAIHASAAAEAERLCTTIAAGEPGPFERVTLAPLATGQLPLIELSAPDAPTARRIVDLLEADRYVSWRDLEGGAARSFFATRDELTLVRTEGTAFTVRMSWPAAKLAERLPSALLPAQPDWEAISLPERLWPLYFLVRPVRLIRDRLTSRSQPTTLGPILVTPESLIPHLLDFADVTEADVVADLGCGDGRLVVAAAEHRGCRAVGVENDPQLAERARRRAAAAGVEHLVRIVEGDATDVDVGDATVILLFVPVESLRATIDSLRHSGFGGRIVAHEQQRPPAGLDPHDSTLLVAPDAMTVAHRFDTA